MDLHFRITISGFQQWGGRDLKPSHLRTEKLCFSCAAYCTASTSWHTEQLILVSLFMQQERRKKEIHLCPLVYVVVLFPDQCILQLPGGRKKQIVGFLNALFILFIWCVFVLRADLDNIGYKAESYAKISLRGGWRMPCWGSAAVAESCEFRGSMKKRFCFTDMESLPQLFSMWEEYINYTSLLEVEEKASGVPSSWVSQSLICSGGWERHIWGHVLSLLYIYIRPEKFKLKVILTSEWEACGVLDDIKQQKEADSSLNIK